MSSHTFSAPVADDPVEDLGALSRAVSLARRVDREDDEPLPHELSTELDDVVHALMPAAAVLQERGGEGALAVRGHVQEAGHAVALDPIDLHS